MTGFVRAAAASDLREQVRDRYATAATAVSDSAGTAACCPTPVDVDDRFGSTLYPQLDRDTLPVAAVAASLGCGNPTAVADLRLGERVLDLGSGGGIDVLLSAQRVGVTGFVYGLDMTTEMLDLARANAASADVSNVEFIEGTIEEVPLPDGAVDVVISNCVINLSVDKPQVIAEMFRVLAPGGRIGISDVVAEDRLSAQDRLDRRAPTPAASAAHCPRPSTWRAWPPPASSTPTSASPIRQPTACTGRSSGPANPAARTPSPRRIGPPPPII